jgi:hypothetical protein
MSSTTFIVDTVGFRVPCRSFHVRANVTRDRPLPVVDEFVLRLLRICGQLTLERTADFFGFTQVETERVVRDLVTKDLLVAEGNELRLSTAAAGLFRSSADEEPRLVEVEPWIENVWIDLVSRGFVARPRQRAFRNLVDVPPAAGAIDLPTEFARAAFEENFRDYVTHVRRLREPERVSIHSIAGVESDRYGSIIVAGRKTMTLGDRGPKLELEGAAEASRPQMRQMIQSLSSQYGLLQQPRAQATSLLDFERLSGVQLRNFLGANQEFDLERWLQGRPRFEDGSCAWMVGAPYIEANVEALVGRLKTKKPSQLKPDIRWLRPGGTAWGMTSDLGASLERLRQLVGLPDIPKASGTTLLMPKATSRLAHKSVGRLFERGEEAPARLGSGLEILVVGQAVAILLVHVVLDRRETVPLGIIVDHAKLVMRLDAQLRGENLKVWAANRDKGESTSISALQESESIEV